MMMALTPPRRFVLVRVDPGKGSRQTIEDGSSSLEQEGLDRISLQCYTRLVQQRRAPHRPPPPGCLLPTTID
jgi:hypothetical protein